jgi:hypothetical protein
MMAWTSSLLRPTTNSLHVDAVMMLQKLEDEWSQPYLGGKEGEDASAAADVHHNLVFEEERILNDRIVVRLGAHLVLQHFLMNAWW